MFKFFNRTACLVLSLACLGLMVSCAKNNVTSKQVEDNVSPATNTEARSQTSVENPPAKIPPKTDGDRTERLYSELVEQHGANYQSCGASIQVEANACSAEGVTGETAENLNVELILDASGSMAGLVKGEPKLTVAREALIDFASKLPERAKIALRVYGHIGSNQERHKAESCAGSQLLYNFQPLDRESFTSAIESLEPTGWTPIADSLQQAKNDFSSYGDDSENVIYLVSDGIETCDGDPVAAARALNQSQVKAVVNIIGFDVDATAQKQLRAVAEAGGGEYIQASDRLDLYRILNQRIVSAAQKYNCTAIEQSTAYNKTVMAQSDRYSCIISKATKEYTKMISAINQLYINKEIDRPTRTELQQMAREKRTKLVGEARTERQNVTDRAREERKDNIDRAREEKKRAIDKAKEERNSIK